MELHEARHLTLQNAAHIDAILVPDRDTDPPLGRGMTTVPAEECRTREKQRSKDDCCSWCSVRSRQ
jgi:hypothetical protein